MAQSIMFVLDDDGRQRGLTIVAWHNCPGDRPAVPADRLITLDPAAEAGRPPGLEVKPAVWDPLQSLGKSVQRLDTGSHAPVPGQIVALRGTVLIEAEGRTIRVSDMLEVHFDEVDRLTGRAFPPLGKDDRGRPVSSPGREPIGLLVAGSGHTGFIAPLRPFLDRSNLTVSIYVDVAANLNIGAGDLARHQMMIDDGLVALSGELSRESSCPREPAGLWSDAA